MVVPDARPPMTSAPTIPPMRHLSGNLSSPGNRRDQRCLRVTFTALLCFTVILLFWPWQSVETKKMPVEVVIPPLYERYHHFERNLPQLDLSLPAPDGRHAKYFWARNHVHDSGWGNVMQELFLNSHLAYKSGRAFVFSNYSWDDTGLDYTTYNGTIIPNHIPLTAMIIGPIVGGLWPPGINASRAVTKEWFDTICPNPTVVTTQSVITKPTEKADVLIDKWIEKLKSIDDACLELDQASFQIFNIWVFGSARILPAWPQLFESPIITQFGWSDMITSAFEMNIDLFLDHPLSYYSFPVVIPGFPSFPSHSQSAPLPGLLALHIRRGDFIGHCEHLARYSSSWNGFNMFPELPDKFVLPAPANGSGITAKETRNARYARMCFPSVEQIVQKVMEIKTTPVGRTLDRIYVMTDGDRRWTHRLKRTLREAAEWKSVASRRNLVLTHDQRYVAQAVDMFIGQRAQVFVGNGFSSLTSNVVMLRMARQFPPESTRFWS